MAACFHLPAALLFCFLPTSFCVVLDKWQTLARAGSTFKYSNAFALPIFTIILNFGTVSRY